MTKLFVLCLSGIFTENILLIHFYGICPFLGVSKSVSASAALGLGTVGVMTLSGTLTYLLSRFFLSPLLQNDFTLLTFLLIISFLVQCLALFLKKFFPDLHAALGIYLPLLAVNCGILAVCQTIKSDEKGVFDSFLSALLYSFGSGMGFFLALMIFTGVRKRLDDSAASPAFRGIPLVLISAGLCAMAFFGFSDLSF